MSVSRETLRLQRASSFIMHLYVQTHKRLYVNRDWRASSRDQRVAPRLPQPKRPMTIETRPFRIILSAGCDWLGARRSEEHTPELQPIMRITYATLCLKQKNY